MNNKLPNRKSIRLKGYDYSQAGLYFITMVTQNRACLFGGITEGKIKLNSAGQMVERYWFEIANRFPTTQLHEIVVMPNHFHAILEIVGATLVVGSNNKTDTDTDNKTDTDTECGYPRGIPQRIPQRIIRPESQSKTVGDIIGAFKSLTTNGYIRGVKNDKWKRFNGKLWQRNYWEHIIRNEDAYHRIAQYIIDNPTKWVNDKLNNGSGNIVMEPRAAYGDEPWTI